MGRKLQKIGFFGKTGTNFHSLFLQIITCGYILALLLKQLFFHTKPRWKYLTNQILQKYPQIIVENTKNLPDSVILHNRIQNSEKFLTYYLKIGISSSATAIVLQTSVNCSHIKLSKQQLSAHMSIVKVLWQSVANTHYFSSNALLSSRVLKRQLTFSHKISKQINLACILLITIKTYHNSSFFSYKKQHFYRFIQLATTTRHKKTFNNDM